MLALRSAKIEFTAHFYAYEERGGTAVSSRELGVDEHHVVKTLVMENENADAFIVLMHGDMKVSTKELARIAGVKRVVPCAPDTALRHSGYRVGGTSPFGTRRRLPVYMQASILGLPRIYINGGSRGFLVGMAPQSIVELLRPVLVEVAIPQ